MTRIGRRLIEDFLLPALNEQRYGDLLKWVDPDKCYFSIRWSHKNAAKWSLADTAVFQDWDKLKGHYHPEVKGYYMQAKQRFRAALYKLSSVRKVNCEDKHVKKYELVLDPEKRKTDSTGTPKIRNPKKATENNQNRASVITKHTSSGEIEHAVYYSSPSRPASPSSSDCSDTTEFASCIHDYKIGQKMHNQMIRNTDFNYTFHISPRKEYPLKEVNDDSARDINYMQRTPHMPIQPAPVYIGPSKRYEIESPRLLLVKTYNEIQDVKCEIKEECPDFEEEVSDGSSDFALNLSVKSNESDVVSR